jgi:hypothetical protein
MLLPGFAQRLAYEGGSDSVMMAADYDTWAAYCAENGMDVFAALGELRRRTGVRAAVVRVGAAAGGAESAESGAVAGTGPGVVAVASAGPGLGALAGAEFGPELGVVADVAGAGPEAVAGIAGAGPEAVAGVAGVAGGIAAEALAVAAADVSAGAGTTAGASGAPDAVGTPDAAAAPTGSATAPDAATATAAALAVFGRLAELGYDEFIPAVSDAGDAARLGEAGLPFGLFAFSQGFDYRDESNSRPDSADEDEGALEYLVGRGAAIAAVEAQTQIGLQNPEFVSYYVERLDYRAARTFFTPRVIMQNPAFTTDTYFSRWLRAVVDRSIEAIIVGPQEQPDQSAAQNIENTYACVSRFITFAEAHGFGVVYAGLPAGTAVAREQGGYASAAAVLAIAAHALLVAGATLFGGANPLIGAAPFGGASLPGGIRPRIGATPPLGGASPPTGSTPPGNASPPSNANPLGGAKRRRVAGACLAYAAAAALAAFALGRYVPSPEIYASIMAATLYPLFAVLLATRVLLADGLPPAGRIAGALAAFAAAVGMGGYMVASLLSAKRYLLNIGLFRGVVFSLTAPVLCYGLYFIAAERRGLAGALRALRALRPGRRAVAAAAVLAALALFACALFVYVARSGNKSGLSASGLEMWVRDALERLMLARPRFKEFLIGWPCFFAAAFFAVRQKSSLGARLAGLGLVFGACSIVNSFCHVFTKVEVSASRTLNGMLLGLPAGLLAYAALLLAESLWRRRKIRQ